MKVTFITFASLFFLTSHASPTVRRETEIEGKGHLNRTDAYAYVCSYNSFPVPLLRAYDGRNFNHFYTADAGEMKINAIQRFGLIDEGHAGSIFSAQEAGTVSLYRLYNRQNGDHFYTTDAAERDHAVAAFGYSNEGTTGFVYPSQTCGAQPLYRLYGGGRGADHLYTMSAFERDFSVAQYGYKYEAVAAYILPI
ncbi:hypothetical protein BU17DRAFT_95879 [Hysterangium stoloniferum]|nr:hypothetical protein BU17DRAFT_95879 [Hysterangium stoloniferum]